MGYRATAPVRRLAYEARYDDGVMRVAAAAFALVVAFLLGMIAEKVRFGAHRDEVMSRYERALADWRAAQVRGERAAAEAAARRRGEPMPPPLGTPLEGSVLPPQDR